MALICLTCLHTSLALEEKAITLLTLVDGAIRLTHFARCCATLQQKPRPSTTIIPSKLGRYLERMGQNMSSSAAATQSTEQVRFEQDADVLGTSLLATAKLDACLDVGVVVSSMLALVDPTIVAPAFELTAWCMLLVTCARWLGDSLLIAAVGAVSCALLLRFSLTVIGFVKLRQIQVELGLLVSAWAVYEASRRLTSLTSGTKSELPAPQGGIARSYASLRQAARMLTVTLGGLAILGLLLKTVSYVCFARGVHACSSLAAEALAAILIKNIDSFFCLAVAGTLITMRPLDNGAWQANSDAAVLSLSITSVLSYAMRLRAFAKHGYQNPFLDHPHVTEQIILNTVLGIVICVPAVMQCYAYLRPRQRLDWIAPLPATLTAFVFSRMYMSWLVMLASLAAVINGVVWRARDTTSKNA